MMTGEFACLDRVYMMVSRDAGQLIRGVQRDHSDVCFFLGFGKKVIIIDFDIEGLIFCKNDKKG